MLKESDFLGEARKVRARLRAKGIGVGKNRVLRLMRENGLLAPVRRGKHPVGTGPQRPDHDGCAERAVGYGATRFYTIDAVVLVLRGGGSRVQTWWAGWRRRAIGGQRSSRRVPGLRTHMDGSRPSHCLGLRQRGPQYTSSSSKESWPGSGSARPSYVGEPECNGVAERFMRTLKEECCTSTTRASRRPGRDRCVHRTLQPRVAPGAARVSDPGPGPSGAHPEGGMIRPQLQGPPMARGLT